MQKKNCEFKYKKNILNRTYPASCCQVFTVIIINLKYQGLLYNVKASITA